MAWFLETIPEGNKLVIPMDGGTFVIPLEGVVDIASVRAKMMKDFQGAKSARDSLAARLDNPSFLERAKADVILKTKTDYMTRFYETERLYVALKRLGSVVCL
jgi:valyl-tRNA synthetase